MGQIITFYSYKGGVGRTFALVNIGVLIAGMGKRVLLMDWDLEAPGMEHFFAQLPNWTGIKPGVGILPLLEASRRTEVADWKSNVITIPTTASTSVDFIPSGSHTPGYAEKLRRFPWESFFGSEKRGPILERMRTEWTEEYDFVLIDSRTGLTEIGGVCTILLPDILAVVFTAAEQSLGGLIGVIESARQARTDLKVARTDLGILPILSRFDGGKETKLAEQWLDTCAMRLKPYFDVWLPQPDEDTVKRFLGATRIPHVPRYTFGEPLAALENDWSPDLAGSYLKIHAEILVNSFQNALEIANLRPSIYSKGQEYRFAVAFSFGQSSRQKMRSIAKLVAEELGREQVFFDEWYEHEILGSAADVQLQQIYSEQSLMVVAELSSEYADRPWASFEARAIRSLRIRLDSTRDATARLRLLNIRLKPGDESGVVASEAYLDGITKSAEQCADLILRRYKLLMHRTSGESRMRDWLAGYNKLTARERQVFELVVSGMLNKQIAVELGTVERTVKVHRARVMEKMRVASLAELARVWDLLRASEAARVQD